MPMHTEDKTVKFPNFKTYINFKLTTDSKLSWNVHNDLLRKYSKGCIS